MIQELRAKDTIQAKKADKKNATFRENNAGVISQLKSELILYKTRYNRAIEKEKRIKVHTASFLFFEHNDFQENTLFLVGPLEDAQKYEP